MKKLEGGIIERAMIEWRIVVTLIAVLVLVGMRALVTMPRQEFPEFTIRQGLVIGVMPGASSAEVEQRLAKPVEEYLFTYGEVNKAKTYSESTNGQVVVHVELREEIKGADAPAFWVKVRHGLNELKAQKLPPNVVALVGMNDFGDTSALLLAVTAEGRSPRDLQQYLEVLEKHLRRLESTSKLKRVGLQNEVIRVTVAHERLARYGVRAASLWATLQGLGAAPAGARLDTDTLEMPVHVGNVLRSEQEIGDTIVLAHPGGANVRLKDVATITREYGHDDAFVLHDDDTAVVVSVEMRKLDDIVGYGKKVDAAIEEAKHELPPEVKIWRVADQPEVVAASVGHFLRDFGIAIVSVILVTMVLLPLRVASVAAVTIPVCIFITLGILAALGVELQTVSLAGLIVVLGMVVDNAIVIIDDHVEKLDHGMDPWTAAWKSARDLVVPVSTATVAIIMAYVPFSWFMTGQGGDFLASLPVTIAVALITSMVVAALLVPILTSRFIRKGLHRAEGAGAKPSRPSILDRLQGRYDAVLERAFRRPTLTVGIGVASIAIAIALFTVTSQQLFPKVDRAQFAVEITLPPGRPLQDTASVARRVGQELRKDHRVTDVTSFVGTSSPRFHTLYEPRPPGRHRAQLIVNTISDEATVELIREYEPKLATAFADGWVRLKQMDLQNSSAPVEARFSGEGLEQLRAVAAKAEAYARTIPGATWVRVDVEEPIPVVEVDPDQDALARLGLSPALLQLTLASTSRKGFEIGSVWEGDYRVPVLLADDPRLPVSMEKFRSQYVSSPLVPTAVPLEEIGRVRPAWSEGTRIRRNGTPTVTVRVDTRYGVLAATVQQKLQKYIESLGPMRDVTVTWGGEAQSMVEQYVPLTKSLLTSVAFIYLILLFQFRRHKKALVVMLTMPLSLFGAVVGLQLTGYPFGFTAFMGLISLMGVVVRNGIILVGYAEELHRGGLSVLDAAMAAGKRRMRPIFLTSAAAAVGVIPMITSRSPLWGPMGAVTCFGLLLSMVLTLFVLPVSYWLVVGTEGSSKGSARPTAHVAGAAVVLALACWAFPAAAQGTPDAPLSLDECKTLASKRNVEVQRADAEVRSAEQTRWAARTAYVPQVSATGAAMKADSPLLSFGIPAGNLPVLDGAGAPTGETAFFPGKKVDVAEDGNLMSVTAVQPVFAGGRIVNANRLASVGVRAAEDKRAMVRRDARLEAEEKYWQVVALAEKDRTLRAYQDTLEAFEKEAQDAFASGLSTRNDVLKVQLERGRAAVRRLELESARRLAARDLRRFLGLPDGDDLVLADAAPPQPTAPNADRDGEHAAPSRRLEVKLLESSVESERLQARLKLGEGLPTLAVGASASRSDFSGVGAREEALVFATLTVPLTGLWRGAHESAAAREKQHAAELRLADGKRLVAEEASKSWDDLDAAWSAAQVADAGVQQAEVNLAEERDGYESGLETFSDLLEAQTLMHEATNRRIDARIAFTLKRSAYLRAIAAE
jgi:multidrug efflux pump subunit AcrB/outer membrane protein TolC